MFPIRDTVPSRTLPYVMWTLILANAGVFLYQVSLPESDLKQLVYLFGLVPRRFAHPAWAERVGVPVDNYWPFVTSMFLHGGWFHLISNMWSLWIFGDNVEDRMGHVRFAAFYVLCGIAAGVAHMVTNASSPVPAIGASGAIAGVLAAYLFMYPLARVTCLIPIFFYPLFVQAPAFVFILVWFWSQVVNVQLAWMTHSRGSSIGWWAHIGGFLAGVALHRFFIPLGAGGKRAARPN